MGGARVPARLPRSATRRRRRPRGSPRTRPLSPSPSAAVPGAPGRPPLLRPPLPRDQRGAEPGDCGGPAPDRAAGRGRPARRRPLGERRERPAGRARPRAAPRCAALRCAVPGSALGCAALCCAALRCAALCWAACAAGVRCRRLLLRRPASAPDRAAAPQASRPSHPLQPHRPASLPARLLCATARPQKEGLPSYRWEARLRALLPWLALDSHALNINFRTSGIHQALYVAYGK